MVNELFEDIKDGVMLLALLEVLSGQKLPCEQGRQMKRIHWLSNIGTALKFLEGRRIKLVNINSTDIVDGKPSIVLGLMWTIILYFQIEELTSNLHLLQSLSSSTSSLDSSETASPPVKRKVITKFQGNAKKALLKWVQHTAAKQLGIEVNDFGKSWRSGVAFHSVIYAIRPDLVDMDKVRMKTNRENLEDAFTVAENELGIPRLLDPEDVDVDKPDEKSIMTYVAQFLKHYPDPHNTETGGQGEEKEDRRMLREVKAWLEQYERDLSRAQVSEGSLQEKYQLFKSFRVQYEMKKKQIEALIQPVQREGKLSVDQALVKQAWEKATARLLEWHIQLDKSLPGPLGAIGAWLHRAEEALREEITVQQAHEETANIIHRKLEQHKEVLKGLEGQKQTFLQIHRAGSVKGVLIPAEQLEDMAQRFHFVSSTAQIHLIKLEFWELKYRLLAFLMLAESMLKSWIIKYGRRESVELLLQNYISFIEGNQFFERYEVTYQTLKQTAEVYVKSDGSAEEAEGLSKFLNDTAAQWRNLSVEVRSVRSMLEEVISNWDKYSSTVAGLQAWLEDAEKMLNQPENAQREFFRNLPHWIQQHTAMNDSGNFLIETSDETVSRDLKQQLLLLNGRWRELFVKVKQYVRADEVDKIRKEYQDGISALKAFLDTANEKMTAPVDVSFLNVRTFVQEVEDIKQKVPVMEAQYKSVTRNAQVLNKDTPQEEASEMFATMTGIKEQLSKIREIYLPLLRESQSLLSPLEETEKQITSFYESLEKASIITAGRDTEAEAPGDFRQQCQELLVCQENCKKSLAVIGKNSQSFQRVLVSSKTLQHFDCSMLQKRIDDLKVHLQTMIKEAGEWRKHIEANSSLMKRFEESRIELEKVLNIAQTFLKEKGNPEEVLKKHTEFFGQLDQRVLNAFLKACDELTDILPEQEQQSMQETVKKLHKQWKDIQAEAPYHLLHLKIEVEENRLQGTLEECTAELVRENKALSAVCSEQLIKEHRAFFGDRRHQQLCEKRLQLIDELCQKLPEKDPACKTVESCKKALTDVKSQIDSTYQKLQQHPDKFSELAAWLSAKESQLSLLKNRANDPSKYGQVKSTIEEVREDAEKKEGSLSWLKSRLSTLIEVSSENEAKRQEGALTKLSSDFKGLLASLAETEKVVSTVGDCVQFKEEVKRTLEELVQGQKEAQAEADKILDSESVQEAQQLLLIHQQQLKRLRARSSDVQQQIARGQQLQAEEGLASSLQPDLQNLESALTKMEQSMETQEKSLQTTLSEWQQFDTEKEAVVEFLKRAGSNLERDLTFSSLESLSAELEQTKELIQVNEIQVAQADVLVKKSTEIKLGPKNKTLLQQQATSIKEQVNKVENSLKKDVKQMEMVNNKWKQFGNDFEALSCWISEKEKELDDVNSSSLPLELQISKVKALGKELEEKMKAIRSLEEESQALGQFVSSGEAARIKARLTQISRHWDELKEHTQHLERVLQENASHQHKFQDSLKQAQQTLANLEEKLACPISSCSSVTETYKVLQEHMDVIQAVEQLKSTLASLSAGARKVSDRGPAEQEVVFLQQRYEKGLQKAKDKQTELENLLALWQKYEKEESTFVSWLERCETAANSQAQYISADRAKLQSEVQNLQDLQTEVSSHESIYKSLMKLATCLFPTASESKVKGITQDLDQLDKRWCSLSQVIPQRISLLQSQVNQLQQFDESLLQCSYWIEQFLSGLQSTSEVNTTDLQPAFREIKEKSAMIQKQAAEKQSLQDQVGSLCSACIIDDHHPLQVRKEDCFQLFREAEQVVERRKEVLKDLEAFLQTRKAAMSVLHRLKQTVESASNWDKGKAESLQQDLKDIIPDIHKLETLSVNLDGALSKAQYHIREDSAEHRTSCRALADLLGAELEMVQNLLGTKQSEAEAIGALWNSFKERKEQLLKSIEDIEEKADKVELKEPTLVALQQRLRVFNQLEDEFNSHQHEMQWLMDKAKQLAQKDTELAAEADKEIGLLEVTWEDTKTLISENQENCCVLVDLMREYQSKKSTIIKIIESAENVAEIKSALKDQEDIRRTLSRVSERIDDNIERLSVSLALWEDVLNISDEIDLWSNSSISELSENLSNLSNSQRMESRLVEFQSEVESKEQKLKTLNVKVSELKQITKSQEPPTELQVIEADLRKKINHAQEMSEVARGTLRDFRSQKQQLESFISQMTSWLSNVEQSLTSSSHSTDPEDLRKVKEIQKELQKQQSSIDSTRENLNSLCRKYPSSELEKLGCTVTELMKKYEAVNQLASKTLSNLHNNLEQHFNDLVQKFHGWLSDIKDTVRECSDRSGDLSIMEEKLQKLKEALSCVDEGEKRLTLVCEDGEKLLMHLPKPNAGHIQQQLSASQQEWDSFMEQCRQNQQAQEESVAELTGFDSQLKRLSSWVQQMEERLNTELLGETKQHIPEKKAAVERVEEFHEELLRERDSFEQLCQKSQGLSESGCGDGREVRTTSQLQSSYQNLVKAVKERLRVCQVALQEHLAFEETQQSTWAWLKEVQDRLAVIDSITGSKESLEKRLVHVQEILLMKGEGEVKLNMAIGKGEQTMKSSNEEGQKEILSQLQTLKDVWANVIMASMSCHSRLEWTVAQWNSYLESESQLQQWLESVEQEVGAPMQQQPGLKEKACLLDRNRAILADVENHSAAFSRLADKAGELLEKTGDTSFRVDVQAEMRAQFGDITAVVKGKVKTLEDIVDSHRFYHEAVREFTDWLHSAKEELQRWSDMSGDSTSVQRKLTRIQGKVKTLEDIVDSHRFYHEAVREFTDWLHSAKEELQRWSDMSGDSTSVQRKLTRIQELIDSRQNGRQRLNRVQEFAAVVKEHTAGIGCELIDMEVEALQSDWEQWERSTKQTQGSLESTLSQMASSEQEFTAQASQLEQGLQEFSSHLKEWGQKLNQVEECKNTNEEVVEGWKIAKETLDALMKAEHMSDSLKTQLNDLCRFSRDLSSHSEKVSALIKEYNSLCLQASKERQNKEKLLEQRFRSSLREFQQWLVSAKITTAKCFDVPQNINEASTSLLKIQEFLSDREQGQSKVNAVFFNGELLSSILPKVETIQAKVTSAREDWKNLLSSLHQRETALQNLLSQMKDFETSAEPLQEWLNGTETAVQESSARLHNLQAKKQEQHKLQSVLEEIACQELQLNRLKEKAHQLWEGQAAGKSFMHRVSQLSAQYLALSNLTKEKASRIERIVSEHQLFSQGLKELQDWVADANHMLASYCSPTADKNVLDSRMSKLEALLAARHEKEIQLKMLLTRGESVQRNTSPEGVPFLRKQIQDLKDSWDSLLSASIQCKSQLEGALSQWTSYQEDVRQFVSWMDRVDKNLNISEKQYSEMRDKTANLGKAKLLHEEVLSHNSLLETIAMKGSSMAEHYETQLEIQDLQERYSAVKDKAKGSMVKAEELVLAHQEYQRGLHMFEDWLEQEQERLGCCSQMEGDVETLENTLLELQDLQVRCTEGQALLDTVLSSREQVIPWGAPQIEDRALETVEQDWQVYQARLAESRAQLNTTLTKLRQMEQKFQHLDAWLRNMESKGNIRSDRRSDRDTKEAQLQMMKSWHEETLVYKDEVEGVSALAQQVLEETHISSRVSSRATQLTARYQALLLHLLETMKQLEEEIRSIEEAMTVFSSYTDWLSAAQKNFKNIAVSINVVDRVAMENKMKKLELLQSDIEVGHRFLKAYLEEAESQQLRQEVDTQLSQLDELIGAARVEYSTLEKSMHLSKEFLDKYKGQAQWLMETQTLLHTPVEPKTELYEKKAQLAKYKTIQQTVLSHESSVKSVIEKGRALLDIIRDPSVSNNMNKLQSEYHKLCNIAVTHVQNLVTRVKEHEAYNSDLQEVEKWLLQMSSRLVTSDSMQSCNLEMATQQLARHKASTHLEDYNEMLEFIMKWSEKAKALVESHIVWSSASQLHDQLRTYQAVLQESGEIHSDLEAMSEKIEYLSEVYHTQGMSQQVSELSRQTEELQQQLRSRFQSLQDAAKDMERFESEVKALHAALEQAQATLTSPELARLSLREQLSHRQRLLTEMETFKQKVEAVQACQSALRIPEEVVTNLAICQTALRLQEEASRLQHTTIQQCNILQEALVQYEQYEQEVKHLQRLIEEAHRVIQDRPVSTSNIKELQAQISHHEALAQKIKGYQEQIASLNSKCKMLTMKAKHATMLLTVTEVEGLSEGLDEFDAELLPTHSPAHPSVVMMTAGRCHTLLSPVTEESGEEGTNSEISSPPTCRSPSPVPNTDASVNQDIAYYQALSAEQLQTAAAEIQPSTSPAQELCEPGLESAAVAKLDDLQRSWETLKNVISEKQRTLYEALERQQKFQDSLQSISTKMESIETNLNGALEADKTPESQMAAHQALMDEILMLQDEINELQTSFAEELVSDTLDTDTADQLAMQSTLIVLAERMATIRMKASGKRQLLEEKLNDQLEEQHREQALQRYHSEADELDHWLLSTKATLKTALQPAEEHMHMEEQLNDCQNMLLEIELKVVSLSELSVHSETLLMEGKVHTREEAEQLAHKLRTLKGSLLELQRMLQDKQINIHMLLEIELKVVSLSELSVHSETLLMEGKVHTREEAEQLAHKLRTLKGSLLELQRMLQDKQINIQGTLQEKEDSEPSSALCQSPSIQEWLAQARTTRSQRHQDSLQRQRELEEQLAEQKKLLQSVASRGEELLSQQTATKSVSDSVPRELNLEGEKLAAQEQMRQKWESLNKEFITKQQLLQNTLQQDHSQPVYSRPSRVSSTVPLFKGELPLQDKSSVRTLFSGFNQAFEDVSSKAGGVEKKGLDLEQRLYSAVCASSSWLDGVENSLFAGPVLLAEDAETQLCNQEVLGKDIREVTEDVNKNRDLFLQAAQQCRENQDVIDETLCCLQERLGALDSVAELKMLFTALADSKYLILHKLAEAMERPAAKQMEAILESEESLKEFEQKINELKSHGQELQPGQPAIQELMKLQDTYEELVLTVGSRRSGLNQSLALKGQYERALQDLADLVDTAQDKTAADQKIIASSKEEVQNLLDKHKEFFQGLESHMILTETFFRKICSFALPRECQSHDEIMAQAAAVLKQAHKRGVELEYILETWTRLEEDYQSLYRQLEAVESSIPSVGLVEETEERLTERIALYQRLKASLTEHQHQLYQVLDDGKRLLMSVCCSDLENQLTQLGEHWLNNTTRVNKELQRLDTILEHWTRYQNESAELGQWLQTALDRLEFWSTQSVTVPQELETVRDHLNAFLEFSKEVDAKSSLKSSVLSTGNQLLHLKKVDTAGLRSGLAQTDNQWAELLTRIPVVQEKLHQLQMEKLPSRHAITELMSWITLMENIIEEDEERIKGVVGSQGIQEYLQKYKGFKIDVNCKQLTVDFVNQSVLQISSQDVESKRSDKTDFAERLGAMNRRWQILQSLITEKELENTYDGWTEDLAHLSLLKESLSSYISVDDLSVLQERIELLQRQWEELFHQLSLRRQQVSEKLNEWGVFNEKNKELCEWLTQMEGKVSQNGDISIEEMIEKLRKDYQEEISVAQENKVQLQQMGERLAMASHESKAAEIEYKLSKVNDRWQHLLDLIGARVKKLKETLVAVQQLDKNMSNLRSWLAHIETELSKPIVYETSDSSEIQRKLKEQQDLQRDIEKHSTGVASVLNLCEVLLHDCDACATDTECDSIQQATRSLDRRWRNICAMSMERRLKIEETWRLWQKFLDDFSRFEDWLKTSERTAAIPNSAGVLYTVAKEELKKFEAFQRQVHESLTQLELINKQYRRLARENRTDSSCRLKQMVHDGNQRWDNLQRRVASILRRLKHFICQREEFETARDSILVWLTEMDLQLTNIEHFSECDVQAKIKQLRAFQQEISLNSGKIEQIFHQGELLIEKSEPLDAAVIEEELEELQRYCQEVFSRVERYYKKLIRLPLTDDEHDVSDQELDLEDVVELSSLNWNDKSADSVLSPHPSSSRSTSMALPVQAERSGRDTPASVDSIPLEWDHDYDLSRGLETMSGVQRALASDDDEDAQEDDKEFYLRGAAAVTDVVIPESPEAYVKLTENTLRSTSGEPGSLETHIWQLDKAMDTSHFHLQQTENVIRSRTPTGPELDSAYNGYMRLLSECRGNIDTVKRVGYELKEEEDKLSGLIDLNSTETQSSGVIERWELIQAQALSKELRMKQNLQQWQQFNSDLDNIWVWLGETEEELEQLRRLDLSTDIHTIELRIKKLKELQKAVDKRKAIVLSINLCSAEFVQSETAEAQELRARLGQMNKRWDRVGSLIEDWRSSLQDALMQCHDFHEMSHGLLLWLENIDRRRNEIVPIDSKLDSDTLHDHHKTLMQIRRELLESQLKVASLQDMSSQLLVNTQGTDCLEAKEKVHVIGNRLKLLLKEVTRDLRQLERTLAITSSQLDLSSWSSADELDTSGSLSPISGRSSPSRRRSVTYNPAFLTCLNVGGSLRAVLHLIKKSGADSLLRFWNSPEITPVSIATSQALSLNQKRSHRRGGSGSSHSEVQRTQRSQSFFLRVLRAALPLQLLLLLLIGLACLVPMTEEDYSCTLSNNFARSFHPMLRYTNGPPPI
ncbi:Nesprin-1 [Acipenser ruthenus]|uniref:Nesprin-1 n=1 Tax=Acipenser ruthenus TaxID=7906 RepID=A0A444UG13_ACIRT|nr:Nesprin-1 [Acipenser ruthenus]